ncbi:acetyltransferase [Glaciibacter sp. 2TAF33]|uniref:acetyltransferase n=1 Tax=Glaciibacter sp. 2TAF33 TaxID=3233015 RepID=UPI003F932C0B
MVTRPLVVIGAGGFGRETLDVVAAINASAPEPEYELLGVLDHQPSDLNRGRLEARGVAVIATPSEWMSRDLSGETGALYVVAVGNPLLRRQLAAEFRRAGHTAATLIHPSAVVGSQARIGEGAVICAGAQVSTNVSIGTHAHINPNATIGHDSELGDFVSVNPGAIISGDVLVFEDALIGAGAVVLQGLVVGRGSTVGASACVTRDVEPGSTVVGIPARGLR